MQSLSLNARHLHEDDENTNRCSVLAKGFRKKSPMHNKTCGAVRSERMLGSVRNDLNNSHVTHLASSVSPSS
jgi:hypothetical protein